MSMRSRNILAALMALLGWGGLAYLVDRTSPQPHMQLLFLALLLITLIATAYLTLQHLYRRFGSPDPTRALRQGFWLSLFVVSCAWLQTRRVLDWAIALLLATVLGLIEGYLLSRE